MSVFKESAVEYRRGQFLVSKDKTSEAITGKGLICCEVVEVISNNKAVGIKILNHTNKTFINYRLYENSDILVPYENILINEEVTCLSDGVERVGKVTRFIYEDNKEVSIEISSKGGLYKYQTKEIVKSEKLKKLQFLPPLAMDYVVNEEVKNNITKSVQDLLEKFYYSWTYSGIDIIMKKFFTNKLTLINLLSRHPKWNPEKLQIVLQQKMFRELDIKEISSFFKYFEKNFGTQSRYLEELKVDGKTYVELVEELNTYESLVNLVEDFKDSIDMQELLGDLSYEILVEKVKELKDKTNLFSDGKYSKTSKEFQDNHYYMVNFFCSTKSAVLDAKSAEKVNKIIPDMKANSGQKIGRVINKFCKMYGYCDFEIEEDVSVPKLLDDGTPEEDSNGNTVLIKVKKMVKPYEKKFAILSDNLSPKEIIRPLILSVNPVDYLTMSFGNSWTSCHTIDNGDVRRAGTSTSSGCNCLGTMSYMCDPSSLVMYTVSERYEGKDYELEDKINRCMFHYGEGKLIQARVYPQKQDGNDEIYNAFRTIVLEAFNECLGITCSWETTKSSGIKQKYITSVGYHYKDYTYDNGSNISAPIDFLLNKNIFTIGSTSTCVTCGSRMDSSNKSRLSCCKAAHPDTHSKFRKTHPLIGHDPEELKCPHCGKIITDNVPTRVIDGKFYHENCTFYCYHHKRYEVKGGGEVFIQYVGYVCKESLLSGEYFLCEDCGNYFTSADKVVLNGRSLCKSCFEDKDEENEEFDDLDLEEETDEDVW